MYKVDILFEDPEVSEFLRHQRALDIVNTALDPGAVIFSVPSRLFPHHTDAYKLVISQLGPVVCDCFNPVSLRGNRSLNDLVFYTKFREPAAREKALNTGLLIDNVQYRAIPYKDKTVSNDFQRVNMSLRQWDEVDDLVTKLTSSMENYGRVLQIKRLLNRGFFKGEVSVLLDRRTSDQDQYQELQRMLYLEAYDVFVPANFPGAPKICYYCRESGHVRKDCPALQKLQCYRCGKPGHTQRRCRSDIASPKSSSASPTTASQSSTFKEDLDQYAALASQRDSQSPTEDLKTNSVTPGLPIDSQADEAPYSGDNMGDDIISIKSDDMVTDLLNDTPNDFHPTFDEKMEGDNADATTHKQLPTSRGASLSKFAPGYVNPAMDLDKLTPTEAESFLTSQHSEHSARKGHE